ncbi:hypothetical protein D3C72_2195310 [compost metagenome]
MIELHFIQACFQLSLNQLQLNPITIRSVRLNGCQYLAVKGHVAGALRQLSVWRHHAGEDPVHTGLFNLHEGPALSRQLDLSLPGQRLCLLL